MNYFEGGLMTRGLGDEVPRDWPCDLRGSLFHLRPLFSHLENGRLDPDDLKRCFQLAFLSLEALVYPTWSTNNLIHLPKTEGQILTIPCHQTLFLNWLTCTIFTQMAYWLCQAIILPWACGRRCWFQTREQIAWEKVI